MNKEINNLVNKVIDDILNKELPISNLLMRAKVIAQMSDDETFLSWINSETNGYEPEDEVPNYRKVRGEVKFYNSVYGYCPYIFSDTNEFVYGLKNRNMTQSISEVETLMENKKGALYMTYPEAVTKILAKTIEFDTYFVLQIERSTLAKTLDGVKNKILDYALLSLKKDQNKDTLNLSKNSVFFDKTTGLLTYHGKEIEFGKKGKGKSYNNQNFVLDILCDNNGNWVKESEIRDKYEELFGEESKERMIYTAVNQIKKRDVLIEDKTIEKDLCYRIV